MIMNFNFSNLNSNPFSYLEFGSVNPMTGVRHAYDYRSHDQAYEWLMHARYSNDIVAYQRMMEAINNGVSDYVGDIFTKQIHHKDDVVVNNNKLIALSSVGKSFFELGQTLFGCIDAMEFLQQLNMQCLNLPDKQDLHSVNWFGVDVSDFFNRLAPRLHQSYQMKTSINIDDHPHSFDVFFAKGITLLYAINSAEQLFNWLANSHIAIFDYSFCLSEHVKTQIGTGKDVHYLSQSEFFDFYDKIRSINKDIWVRGNAGIKTGGEYFYIEGFVSSESIANNYIEKQTIWHNAIKNFSPLLYSSLIHNTSEQYWTWHRLNDVILNIK